MSTTTYNAVSYLKNLRKYFEGDFATFKTVCNGIEEKERAQTINTPTTHDTSSMDSGNSSGSSGTSGNYDQNLITYTETPVEYRLTIPVTLTIFSVIDIVGWLVGNHSINSNGTTSTDTNFKSFFEYYTNKTAETVPEEDIKMLNRLFRQGVVHRYFPKEKLGVDYHSSNEDKPLFFVPNDSKVRLSLNVNQLYKVVSETLSRLENDPTLAQKDQRLQQLIEAGHYNNDKQAVDDYINRITASA